MTTSTHYDSVKQFCKLSNQETPSNPQLPSEPTRRLQATLLLEETLETVRALGYEPQFVPGMPESNSLHINRTIQLSQIYGPDLIQIADGCADVMVVATGTLVACGIDDVELLHVVDQNNLDKFAPGHKIVNGKLIKPPGHKAPDIARAIYGPDTEPVKPQGA